MSRFFHYLVITLMTVLLTMGGSVTTMAQSRSTNTSTMTAAQKKRAKEKAKAQKKKEKAQAKKAKEKAKKQKAKDKVTAEKQKAADAKQREADKKALQDYGGNREILAKTKAAADRIAKRTVYHHLAMWGAAGYSGMVENYKPLAAGEIDGLDVGFRNKFIGGGGGLIGFGYQLKYKKFLFKVGPEFRLFSSQDRFFYEDAEGNPGALNQVRTDYASMMQHYTFDKYRENQLVGQIMLPIMFGADFGRYYFLAGAKVGYTLMSNYTQRGNLTTTVTDSWAIEDWSEILSHNIETAKIPEHSLYSGSNKGKNPFGLDVALSAEFGLNLNEFLPDEWQARNEESRFPWHMRVAAFIDYGLPIMSAKVADNVPLNYFTGENLNGAPMLASNSIHQSQFASSKVNSLLVGVKFTALLQLNKPKQPNPFICFLVTDTLGKPTKTQAAVEIHQPSLNKKGQAPRKPKLRKMNKEGKLDIRYPQDTYYMVAQANGYLPSNFRGDTLILDHQEDGDSAIFRLIPVPHLIAYVYDGETNKPVAAHLEFHNMADAQYNLSGNTSEEIPYGVGLHYGDEYRVIATKPNYHTDSVYITNLTDTIRVNLRPIHRVRHKLILKHMYFAVDKTEILSQSEDDIMTLYNFLKDNPRIRVLITGHTDSDGSEEHNQKLSEGRAESLKNEMVKRGIAADRMETDGRGESEPIDTNLTPEGKQNNRRVEVTVLNADEAEEDVW